MRGLCRAPAPLRKRLRQVVRVPAAMLAPALMLASPACAATLDTLHSFTGGVDGANPVKAVTLDTLGNLYGPAYDGGTLCKDNPSIGCGVIYRLSAGLVLTPLVTFTGANGTGPYGPLTLQGKTLYGAAEYGGTDNLGTLFRVGTSGTKFKRLYSFAGLDGANPTTGLRLDTAGDIFSATSFGGPGWTGAANSGDGVLFELTAAGSYLHLHDFTGGADGAGPGRIVLDKSLNVFGTTGDVHATSTCVSGTSDCGTVFEYTSGGAFQTIYTFTGGADGFEPLLAGIDSKGNLFGATYQGGKYGFGTLFRLEPASPTYKHVKLWDFTDGADGAYPYYPALGPKDELVGTTLYGPASGADAGVIYRYTGAAGLSVLYTFTGGADGSYPQATPALNAAGVIFGATEFGGNPPHCLASGGGTISPYGCGTLFKLTP